MSMKAEIEKIARDVADEYGHWKHKDINAAIESAIWTALRSKEVGFKEALELVAGRNIPKTTDGVLEHLRAAEAKLVEIQELELK